MYLMTKGQVSGMAVSWNLGFRHEMVQIEFHLEAETRGMNSAISSLIRHETEHEMGSITF